MRRPQAFQTPELASVPYAASPIRDAYRLCLDHRRFRQWKRVHKLRQGRGGTRDLVRHEVTGESAVFKLFDGRRELAMGFSEENPHYLDEGIPQAVVREIAILRVLDHADRIIRLQGAWLRPPPQFDSLVLCYDYGGCDLRQFVRSQQGNVGAAAIRSLSYQLFRGLDWCHSHRILHRNLQPQHCFVNPREGVLKLSGFGLARAIDVAEGRAYTLEVVSLWWRAPELLLGAAHYGMHIDVWSAGLIVPELVTNAPVFPGDSEIGQLFKIFQLLGTPTEATWPGVSSLLHFDARWPQWRPQPTREVVLGGRPEAGGSADAGRAVGVGESMPPVYLNADAIDLVKRCLAYRPASRPTAREALGHAYFDGFDPAIIGRAPLPER